MKILEQNIRPGKSHNFDIEKNGELLGSPYDYGSLMHYGASYFGKVQGQITIQTLNGASIGQRDGLSQNDIEKVKLLYQCESGTRMWNDLQAKPCTSDCTCKVSNFPTVLSLQYITPIFFLIISS